MAPEFIDEVKIEVTAGAGGPGSMHFRREKYVPYGGPDGGNGGSGGSVILFADQGKATLLDFRYRSRLSAQNGTPGAKRGKEGRAGDDLRIPVPPGTEVYNKETGELLADLSENGQEVIIAKGGRGGKGNAFFKSATNQAPDYSQPGEAGESGDLILSLKLLADVGLVGLPNAGKSTLISKVSAAKPKIGDYPFTTLSPQLGVVKATGGASFVMADIPGLIPGAHLGRGLGVQFLKHVERTSVLLHLIDPFGVNAEGEPIDPMESFRSINHELKSFAPELEKKEQLVAITKIDALASPEDLNDLIEPFEKLGIHCFAISSVSGAGLDELLKALTKKVNNH